MARASPDVSRQQARYRRLMQISSARSLDVVPPREGLTDENVSGRRRTHQHWPRKLQPIAPGNGRLLVPPAVPEGSIPLSPTSLSDENHSSRLGVVHSEDEDGSADEDTPQTPISTPFPVVPPSPTDREFNATPTWSPVCLATATVAALSPLSMPPKDDPGPESAAATAAALASTIAVAAAVNGQPATAAQFVNRKPKLLLPMNSVNDPP